LKATGKAGKIPGFFETGSLLYSLIMLVSRKQHNSYNHPWNN